MTINRFIETPLGELLINGDNDVVTGLYFPQHSPAPASNNTQLNEEAFTKAADQILDWFAGKRKEFDIPIELRGSEFQRSVWDALRTIPFGQTVSYAQIAQAIERPGAARACGHAIGRNPVSIIVPCHRVIGANGKLTGYAGGMDRKRWMLEHEQQVSAGRGSSSFKGT